MQAKCRRRTRSGAIEVGHQANLGAVLPDTDPDQRESRVLDVPPVAAVRGSLGLEIQVRGQDCGPNGGIAPAAADVLAPRVAQEAGAAKPEAGVAVVPVVAEVGCREEPGIRPRNVVADPGAAAQRSDIGAVASAAVTAAR